MVVPAAVPATTWTTSGNDPDPPAARAPSGHVIVPVAPTAGVVQPDSPIDWNVVFVGR